MQQDIFEKISELLAIATVHSLEEITPESKLEEDLGINLEEDFARLLAMINHEFEIKLDQYHMLNELEEAEDTVEHLAELVEEEIELG